MPRSFVINGESMVTVKGGVQASGINHVTQLGLTSDQITVSPKFYNYDFKVNDFGPHVPAEIMSQISEVRIRMALVHFDNEVLRICMNESMAGASFGTLAPAGMTLGRGKPLYVSGNHLVSLSITSPQLLLPWTFPATYIPTPPLEIPLGTERMIVSVEWRAFPYQVPQIPQTLSPSYVSGQTHAIEILSSGAVLWRNTPLT